jgi:hypothetical protein
MVQDQAPNHWEATESQPPAPEYKFFNRLPGLLGFLSLVVLLIAITMGWKLLTSNAPGSVKLFNIAIVVAVSVVQFLLLKGASQLVVVIMEMREAIRRNERRVMELAERRDGSDAV